MDQLLEALTKVKRKIERYASKGINEQDTKTTLIQPVLRALEWDVEDLDEVQSEYKPRKQDKPVDYALFLLRTPCLFLEAKSLGQNLDDRRWANQIMGYASVAGVEWVLLTDGNEYRLYNSHATVPIDEKLFRSVRVVDGTEQAADMLLLLSKERMKENEIDVLWKAHFVDRQVKTVVEEFFSDEPDSSLVRLIKKRVGKLTTGDIRASLRRAEVRFDFPIKPIPGAVQPSPRKKEPQIETTTQKPPRITGFVYLSDIIDAGVITTPLKLFRRYKGRDLEAVVQADGSVESAGKAHSTPSAAAESARASVTGRRMNTNGWTFWQYADDSGQLVELKAAREAYLKKGGRPYQPSKPTRVDDKGMSATKQLQLEFWTALRDQLQASDVSLKFQTPRLQAWYNIALGRTGFHVQCLANTFQNRISVRLYLKERVAGVALAQLEQQKEAIHKEMGMDLTWNPHPEKKDKVVGTARTANLTRRDEWPEYLDWMTTTVTAFRKAFQNRIRAIELEA